MGKAADNLQGTLDLLVLRTLSSGETLHGYTIAERIERLSEDVLRVEEGSLYPALHRMAEAGWVQSKWGVSDNNRRARYYAVTARGRRRLAQLERDWAKHVAAVTRIMKLA
ncbi:MAG: PadR family transcriptional regulator [Acidobacteria bacterium]|nr:PadR family transcriptional regulator [Acidobacteriota bacterium]